MHGDKQFPPDAADEYFWQQFCYGIFDSFTMSTSHYLEQYVILVWEVWLELSLTIFLYSS